MLQRWIRLTLALSLLASLALLFLAIPISKNYDFCFPDGRPNINRLRVGGGLSFNPFAFPNLFSINLATGRLNFPTAKFIDVVWDLVVARGGQVLLAAVAYTAVT